MQLPQWQTKSQQWLTDSGRRSIRATKRPKRKRPMVRVTRYSNTPFSMPKMDSEPTSGHFGVTKTYKRIAERFYWKGMITDVRELVSNY